MKVEITTDAVFVPLTISMTVESREEAVALQFLLNSGGPGASAARGAIGVGGLGVYSVIGALNGRTGISTGNENVRERG